MALTYDQWYVDQQGTTPEAPAPEPKTPLQERIAFIQTLSHTQSEDLLVAIARDHPEAFDQGRFAAL